MARRAEVNRKFAVMGADVRMHQLRDEMAEIAKMFPELRGRGVQASAAPRQAGAAKRKRVFSARGKAAISEGMRKYWARRKAKAK